MKQQLRLFTRWRHWSRVVMMLLCSALTMPAIAETLTVYNGTTTNSNVPIYGLYVDDYLKCEYVIPAEDLDEMNGGTITHLKWYQQNATNWTSTGFQVFIKEVDYTTISDYTGTSGATIVYQGTISGSSAEVSLELDVPYVYNGGNLLIGVYNTVDGTYNSCSFLGETVTGASISGTNGSSLNNITATQHNFIPKTTFTYVPEGTVVYDKPTNLQITEITPNSAKLTWEAGGTETTWAVEYKKATDETWTQTDPVTVSSSTITLDGLANGTAYDVRIKSIYTDGESGWLTGTFQTPVCEASDMGEITYELTDTWGDGWNGNKLQIVYNGTVIEELTITSGGKDEPITGTVSLCYGVDYDLVWVAGSYGYECGFTITGPDGSVIYEFHGTGNSSGGSPTAGTLTTFMISRGLAKPTDLAVSGITANSAKASWTGNDDAQSYNLRYRKAADDGIILFQDFETSVEGWSIIDKDGDSNNWSIEDPSTFDNAIIPHSGSYYAFSASWNGEDYTPDNWLLTPKVTFGNTLKYWVCGHGTYPETYTIMVSTTDTNPDSFVAITGDKTTPSGTGFNWAEETVDLSAYEGQQGYIAFRHYNCTGQYFMFLDDIGIYGTPTDAGEWIPISPATIPQDITGLDPETEYEVQVQAVYADGSSDWTNSVLFTTLAADAMPTDLAVTEVTDVTAKASWNGAQDSYNLRYRKLELASDFEDSSLGDWTTIDADGDGYNWVLGSAVGGVYLVAEASMAGEGHSANDLVVSGSYSNLAGALTPDNYLVSPKVQLGGTITFWAKGHQAAYCEEVFGVAVSTTGNTSAADFTMVGQQQTATADWVQYEFDLSAYAGQEGYVAIRHYDITDMFLLDIDDITISSPGSNWTTINNVTSPYTIEGLDPETEYEVQVQGNYDGGTTNWTESVFFTTLPVQVHDISLAQLVEEGNKNGTYNVIETDAAGLLCVKVIPMADNKAKLICKDNGHYARPDELAGQNDYMGGWNQYDQSNWIALNVSNVTADEPAAWEGYMINGIQGKLENKENPEMTLDSKPTAVGDKIGYDPNTYIVPSFYGTQSGSGDYADETYFFVQPKPMEYVFVKWAQWDGSKFVIPTGENANAYGLTGSFGVDWSFMDNPGLDEDAVYQMKGVAMLNTSKAGNFKVSPTEITDDSQVITGVNEIARDGATEVARYNVAGMRVDSSYRGVVIVVMSDGSAHKAVVK